jgi:hypothetical protein
MHLGVFFLLFHELLLSVVLVPGVRADPPPLQQSCADWCNRQYTPNSPGGWIDGTSVFCGGTPNNCPGSLSLLANSSFFDDYGNRCVTGNKYCCCGKSANVAKTSQFFCCSEGNVACGENINDNNCCPEGMNMNMNSSGCTCKGKSSTGMCASINPKSKSQPKPSPSPHQQQQKYHQQMYHTPHQQMYHQMNYHQNLHSRETEVAKCQTLHLGLTVSKRIGLFSLFGASLVFFQQP